ncbi:NUDIX hydrolase [Pseudonocardia bannensis]|uniref:NUDIX hydrolase n=2 Tax=Pseudonocardia bannensis TaxID=630973 RepID=A0A848DCZ0_9PSEU|nr:NUDIX hydrolase [Pseudonocardia bannensis]
MPETPKHSVSVAGVVVDDNGRVLVIKRRDNGHWEPPGGVLELSESFEAGVRREIAEETGISVEVERLTGVYKNMTRGVVALVFRCRPLSLRPSATDEAVTVRWVNPSEVVGLMDPAYAIRIDDALGESAAATRTHDGVQLMQA